MKTLQDYIDKLNKLNFKEMYNNDFFWTWDKTDEELEAVFTVADALRFMRENNISTKECFGRSDEGNGKSCHFGKFCAAISESGDYIYWR